MYLPASARPRRSWSYGKTILLKMFSLITFLGPLATRVGAIVVDPDHRAIMKGKGVKGVWIPPTPELVVGEVKKLAEQGNIESIQIPGYWHDKKRYDTPSDLPARPGEKVFMVLHGGAFIGGTASPNFPSLWSGLSTRLASCHPTINRSLAIEYRLTTGPPLAQAYPFPAALIDALAGYAYLVNHLGFSPENIIIGGDSAGANLAIALTRYLLETRSEPSLQLVAVPAPPFGLALLSPWVDLGDSHSVPNGALTNNLSSDYLLPVDGTMFKYARANYSHLLGFPAGSDTSRWISPASVHPSAEPASFRGFPKSFIAYGEAEIFYDSIKTLEKKMVADMGEDNVFVHGAKDAPHDFMILDFWEPEYSASFDAVAEWLNGIIPPVKPLGK
ncbi:hypothetical protein EIP91_009817 [Steccherinum ochraceum]|uniref:Alpha/beta hydrolase fold-3 domain-containing protein n=1 Tax=Steccherinum ochraceum TaxID=92696 RepID=A0A4R0RNX2_9APHY|nr:hypothetical protein EIP91_009817 [Steccherinum ochraceum]